MNKQLASVLTVYSLRPTLLTSSKKDETAVCDRSCWLFPSSYSYWFSSTSVIHLLFLFIHFKTLFSSFFVYKLIAIEFAKDDPYVFFTFAIVIFFMFLSFRRWLYCSKWLMFTISIFNFNFISFYISYLYLH